MLGERHYALSPRMSRRAARGDRERPLVNAARWVPWQLNDPLRSDHCIVYNICDWLH